MKNFLLESSGKIVFGSGCVREYLAGFAREYGPNTLLVSGVRSGRENGAYHEALQSLQGAGKHIVELPGVRPGPDYETVRTGARLAREKQVDLILGVGGGSVIDCCKAIALAAVYRGDLWTDFWERRGVVDFQPLPVGIIPTTLGTGELNGTAVLNRETGGARIAQNYPPCAPRFILFDPAYTRTLSREQVISGGIRILSRALELYAAPPAEAKVTDALLESLARSVAQALGGGREPLQSAEIRTDLMWAGALVGNDLLQAGKQCRYPCHQAALRLSADTGRPFIQCLAVSQLEAYRAACRENPVRLSRLSVAVWDIPPGTAKSPQALALAGAEALEFLLRKLDLPTGPRDLGLTASGNLQVYTA